MGVDVFTFLYENLRVDHFKKSYLVNRKSCDEESASDNLERLEHAYELACSEKRAVGNPNEHVFIE